MRTTYLPFHLPSIGDEEIQLVVETLRSGWLTTGTRVKQFEREFAGLLGMPYAVALNSCTAAMHLALEAVGLEEGDEVLVPTMTFAATGEVVTYLKAKPVLVDCRPDTLNIDVKEIEKSITPRTKAILPVHFGGHPCEMKSILEIAAQNNLKVIEDAAHALPARVQGSLVGTIGDIGCFSFYATKTITTGEGGMAVTKNPEWAERMRVMSLHGISKDAWKRYASTGSWSYEILSPGFKYNMTDISAALGIQQLKKCEEFLATRNRFASLYNEGFKDLPEVMVPSVVGDIQHAWHLYVIQLDLDRLRLSRDEFIEHLQKHNIGSSVHFIPLHLHPFYREAFGYRPQDFPNASALFERIISLPIYPKMTEKDILDVIQVVRDLVKSFRR